MDDRNTGEGRDEGGSTNKGTISLQSKLVVIILSPGVNLTICNKKKTPKLLASMHTLLYTLASILHSILASILNSILALSESQVMVSSTCYLYHHMLFQFSDKSETQINKQITINNNKIFHWYSI